MNKRHEHEKKQFKALFKQEGVDDFAKRFQILDVFLKTEKHVTCDEMTTLLEKEGIHLDTDYVCETMALLCRFGFADKVEFDDGRSRYEHRHLGLHHDHMICTRCGKIIEFRDEMLEKQQTYLAAAYGFHMLQHKMEIYGICADCLKHRELLIPLCRARQGEFLVIKGLDGGRKAKMRLSSMGLRTGDIIEVVSTQVGGQMVVAAGDSRFVVCHGLSKRIMVQHAQESPRAISQASSVPVNLCMSGKKIQLSEMKQGEEGDIVRVSGPSVLRRRLLEMGLNRGARIKVEKYAPLKDPLELIVKGYHVSLRVEEAANITVENVETVKRQ